MVESKGTTYEFDGFRLEAAERRLTKNGEPVTLPSKAFDLLHVLVENSGHLITKEDLYQRVWAGAIVEDANLTVQMSAIRKALGGEYITTVKGHGYRFADGVRELNGHDDEILLESKTFSRVTVEHETIRPRQFRSAYFFAGAFACLIAAVGAILYFLNSGLPQGAGADGPVQFTKLTSNGKVTNMAVSGDGRYLVFSQKENDGESLWLRQIETGSQTRIVAPRPLDYVGLAITPSGDFIYASLFEKNRSDTSLVKIPLLGGAEEVIPDIATGVSVSFSPDGDRMAYADVSLPETYLKIAGKDGLNQKTIAKGRDGERSFTFFQASSVAWSPDGSTIAAAFDRWDNNGTKAGILLLDPADGSEKVLVEPRWAFVENIAWAGGDNLAFIAYDDELTNQIWIVSRSTGVLRQVTSDLRLYKWLGSTAKGLVAVQNITSSSLRTADFKEYGEALTPKEIFSESGILVSPIWGRDGEIFYGSRSTGRHEIWSLEHEQANPSQLTSGADVTYGLAISPVDGGFVFGSFRDGKYSVNAMDADGKNARSLTDGPSDTYPDVSPTGDIVFQRGINNQQFSVWYLPAGSKDAIKLGDRGLKPVFSPDGRQVAFFTMDEGKWRIAIKSIDSDEPLRKIDMPTAINQRRMRWHPSGKFLTLAYNSGENLNLLLLPIGGGEARVIEGLGKGEIGSFSWSADGSTLLYSVIVHSRDVVSLKE